MNLGETHQFLPYGRQTIDEEDIKQVCDILRSDWLTTGPAVTAFENQVAAFCGTRHAVAVSSGTAALHCAMNAIGISPGDEVIVPPITFAATANAVVYQGGTPVFADVIEDTLLIDPDQVEQKITPDTRAIVAVDYAGLMCDYDRLRDIAVKNNLTLISDACHSIGAEYKRMKAGQCADMTVFSFHPVKHITTGEGGMVVTDHHKFAEKIRQFRNHGINNDSHQRNQQGAWFYEIDDLGFNYRITDFQCALGSSQLKKLPAWIVRRQAIAKKYDLAFDAMSGIEPLAKPGYCNHAYHLYVIRFASGQYENQRNRVFKRLREQGIGVNVHYIPVHLHPFYKNRFDTQKGMCPVAENAYEKILSLPIFPKMADTDIVRVCDALRESLLNG